ncbi:hypothetical protein BY996DRAFT_6528900 [Phakopsora pachyrhizi]|nr:hypothetical protein BY996DRAFT_6528900 [Phakopsora pachyrhizi]
MIHVKVGEEQLIGRITSTPNGGHRTDWATQINQDLTVEEELVTFVETDGVSSAESSPDCGTEELVNSQPIVSVTPAPKATVDCARALLFAPPPSVMVSSKCLFSWRPLIGSCKSLSVVDFGRLGTGSSSSMCALSPRKDFASARLV